MTWIHCIIIDTIIIVIVRYIGGNYIARKSKLVDFNLAFFASPPTRLRDDVTLLRENKNLI